MMDISLGDTSSHHLLFRNHVHDATVVQGRSNQVVDVAILFFVVL
jgi:hypothetical protein